jgi:hypothetical protein
MTLREKIARALQKAHHEVGRGIAPPWELLDRHDHLRWLAIADAVIAIIREPDPETLKRMGDAWKSSHYGPAKQPDDWLARDMGAVAAAMIDEPDDDKDRPICEICDGTGIDAAALRVSSGARKPCFWCEGRGYRL